MHQHQQQQQTERILLRSLGNDISRTEKCRRKILQHGFIAAMSGSVYVSVLLVCVSAFSATSI